MAMIQKLLEDCYLEDTPVTDLLKRAKAVAAQHGMQDFEEWADRELEGYDENNPDALPEYRWVEPSPGSDPARTTLEVPVKEPIFRPMKRIEFIEIFDIANFIPIGQPRTKRQDQQPYRVDKPEYKPLFRAVRDKIYNTIKPLNAQNSDAGTGSVFVKDSVVGAINTGQQIGNQIDVSIATLREANHEAVAEAFEAIKNEIATDKKLTEQEQMDSLEHLDWLASQATLPSQDRKQGIVRSVLRGLATTLSAGGGAAEIWNTAGPIIKGFFGM